ncbi:MAG: tRNA 5-methoxyuridine(34)/uridine 5-oxyacetic acid(34) synthase CmoB [Myxococcota bacterium]|nr:tRNA 5-methoxyuridine(34)/uridine 5-oxyacetic acid(34) synthase CmoB [Myxococcota bacterium]
MQLNAYLASQLRPLVGEGYEKLGPVVDEACRKADADRDRRWLLFEEWLGLKTESHSLGEGLLRLGASDDLLRLSNGSLENWEGFLRAFHPWRKGPLQSFGVDIDTEWRSDWKWDRVSPFLPDLADKRVLDVGTGNGYHLFKLLGAGAHTVLGVEPYWLFVLQFLVMRLGSDVRAGMIPTTLEGLGPLSLKADIALSMGVLSHRQSPFDHLKRMRDQLVVGGTLVLETLVIEGDETTVLVPEGRYAQMRNVWFLPSARALAGWCRRAGFRNVEICDETVTTTDEQRATDWMRFQSLSDYLNPENPSLTIEGHPRPRRAILRASRA